MRQTRSKIRSFFLAGGLLCLGSMPVHAANDTSNDLLMNSAIVGAIGSLGLACLLQKAPCSLDPNINTDRVTFSLDHGEDNSLKQVRMGVGADWNEPLYRNGYFVIDGRWEANINYWYSTLKHPQNDNGWMLGITPVFHYRYTRYHVSPYLEMGGGPQLLSDIQIENEYKSTQFQFASMLGLGVQSRHFELGYRYLHISNANIEVPNPGTDFHNIHLGYKF